jgi:hypothetical protein
LSSKETDFAVGHVLPISDEAAGSLAAAEKNYIDLHTKLGVLLHEFDSARVRMEREIDAAQSGWHELVVETGVAHGAKMGEGGGQEWEYIPASKSFVRTA